MSWKPNVGEKEIEVWGDGTATREFLYVEDAADAIVAATEKYDGGEPVNIGSGQEIDIKTLTETIAQIVGFSGTIEWDSSKPNGQPRRRLDCTRALKEFGFTASNAAGGGIAEDGGVVSAERLESVGYGALKEFGFTASTPLGEGLRKTVRMVFQQNV